LPSSSSSERDEGASGYVYRGRVVSLRVDDLDLGGGRTVRREVVEHPGSVTVVAFDEQRRLLLVRQYRHPAGKDLLELPAGTIDSEEGGESCALRELQEETGYRPGRLERLGGFYLAPGYSTEYQDVFLASDLAESRLAPDEEEDIELVRLPLEEALRLVDSGEIEDVKSVCALLLYLRRREAGAGPPGRREERDRA
jgi:ADP-ribose pyrophosphatase